jgi:hypothetical protein
MTNLQVYLRWLHPHLDGLALERIDRTKVDELRERKLAEPKLRIDWLTRKQADTLIRELTNT